MIAEPSVYFYRVWHGHREAGRDYDVFRTHLPTVDEVRREAVDVRGWTDSPGWPLNIEKVEP